MPQAINTGGPPTPPPNFRGYGPKRRGGGFWSNFGSQGLGFKLNVIGSILGLLAILVWFVWRFLIPHAPAEAQAQQTVDTPAPTTYPTIDVDQRAPAATLPPAESAFGSPLPTPDEQQLQATATFQAAISRPAGSPANAPSYIGVMTYEAGCSVSNLGFTTSGYSGQPFYLYFTGLLDRDPLMQMVQVRGYVQEFDNCQYPVIMVSEVFWLNQSGTPAPIAYGGPISGTITNTNTISGPNPAGWGQGEARATNTPTYTVYVPPQKIIPSTTPQPTYTPYPPLPTYTPQSPQTIYQTVVPLIPTYTPYPTWTPDPATATPTATATPRPATLYGPVVAVGGCPAANFAINANGINYFIIFDGAQLPPGPPTQYLALATGVLDVVCSGQSIKANSITWYDVSPTTTATYTPTLTPTATSTPTPTIVSPLPTPTNIPTATITPTEEITP